ncbi:N-acetylmuramoyl-L-alanine amidase [Candidatus Sumerlaeota bacterium]|nr:N-acetylmuramoyl-L-alanine amidase [Candidatus Sumerlaeota bacterium]
MAGIFALGAWGVSPLAETTAAAKAPAAAAQKPAPKEDSLKVIDSPIAANCFTVSKAPRKIDTVVVHYSSAINWFAPDFQKIVSPEAKAYAQGIKLTKENVNDHKFDWKLVKAIFESYKVSSHYMIARDGQIIRFVKDNDISYHAGKSKMPTDGREGVNGFSIGIEILSTHPKDDPTMKTPKDAYTDAQYAALNKIIAELCRSGHKITAVVGHDEIAPGRKTDPGPLFQWDRVRTKDYKPVACKEAAKATASPGL